MSAFDVVKHGLKYAEPIVHALQLIQNITGLGGSNAAAALKAIDAIVNTVDEGIQLGLVPAEIIKELDKLTAGIADNDAKHDAALANKFPGGK